MIEQVGDILMTDQYWDCECRKNYIHPASENVCTVCHARREEQPDSRVTEVLAQIHPNGKTLDANKTVIIDYMCVIEAPFRKRILVKHRLSEVKNHCSELIFPYGHIEAGKSIVESTIREVSKDTGLTVSNLSLCGVVEWNTSGKHRDSFPYEITVDLRHIVFMFRTGCYSGELKSTNEEDLFEWMTLKELQSRKMALHMEECLQVMMDGNMVQAYGLGCNNVCKILKLGKGKRINE